MTAKIVCWNKKGESVFDTARKTISWPLFGVIITMAVLAFVLIISSYTQKVVEIPLELQAEIIASRFIGAPECFAYQDSQTNRVYPGVIDAQKLTQERLDSCYRTASEKGFKEYNFELVVGDQHLLTNNYFNKVDIDISQGILVKQGAEMKPTQLIIHVQRRI